MAHARNVKKLVCFKLNYNSVETHLCYKGEYLTEIKKRLVFYELLHLDINVIVWRNTSIG